MITNYDRIKNLPPLIRQELNGYLSKANSFYHFNYTENNNEWITPLAKTVYDTIMNVFENRLAFWTQEIKT